MNESSSRQAPEQTGDRGSRNPLLLEFAIQFAVPITITLAVFLIGFLGFKKLERYDSVIFDEREMSADERRELKTDINMRLGEIRATIKAVSEEYVAKAVGERQKDVLEGVDKLQEQTAARIREINKKLEPYRWLASRSDEVDALVGIDSIGVAHGTVTELFQEDKPDMAIRVAEHALKSEISGDPDDFHNLAAELGRKNLFSLASRVVQRGLEHFPQNVDLLSSGIKYLSSNGDIDAADKLVEELRGVPKGHWNWRAFVFLGDYLELTGRFDEAFALSDAFKKQLPYEERAYAEHGQIFQKWGRHDRAIEIFEEGMRKVRKAPQTALLLAQSYIEMGEYAKAITATERAIEGTAEEQPSINIAAIFWTRAKARDALIHTHQIAEQAALAEHIGSAISDYHAAMSMPDRIGQYAFRGPQRIQVLQLYGRGHGVDIPVDDDNDKKRALLDLLQQLSENAENEDGEGGPR